MKSSQVKKMQLVETYAKWFWPIHRFFVRKHISVRCKNCLVTERYSPFVNGACKECREFQPSTVNDSVSSDSKLSQDLHALLQNTKNKKNRYDALLLLSGGKDSAYLLRRLITEHPNLRILTLTIDNGFFSPAAFENIQQTLRKIPVDHVVVKPRLTLYQNVFQYALKHIGKGGCYEIVDRMDGDLLHDVARHYAASMKIPLVISGVSWAQVEKIFQVKHFEMPRNFELSKREYSGQVKLTDAFTGEDLKYWWDPTQYEPDDVARFIFPFYAWRLGEEDIKSKVLEWGLLDKKKLSPLVTNNATIPVMGIADINFIGYSSFEPEFASMVRQGKADRRLWLHIFEMNEYVGKTGWLLGEDVKETLRLLNIRPQEIGLQI